MADDEAIFHGNRSLAETASLDFSDEYRFIFPGLFKTLCRPERLSGLLDLFSKDLQAAGSGYVPWSESAAFFQLRNHRQKSSKDRSFHAKLQGFQRDLLPRLSEGAKRSSINYHGLQVNINYPLLFILNLRVHKTQPDITGNLKKDAYVLQINYPNGLPDSITWNDLYDCVNKAIPVTIPMGQDKIAEFGIDSICDYTACVGKNIMVGF